MTIQTVANLKEFFRDALHDALSHQHVAVEGETEQYVVNMLTLFADPDALYERTPGQPERTRLKPLAMMLGEALEAPTQEARLLRAQARRHRLSHRDGRPRLRHAGRDLSRDTRTHDAPGVRGARGEIRPDGRRAQ